MTLEGRFRIPSDTHRKVSMLDFEKLPDTIAIVGSRSFAKGDYEAGSKVAKIVDSFISKLKPTTIIVSGGAIGVDSYAESAAKRMRLTRMIFEPRPDIPYPKRFFDRNTAIVNAVAMRGGAVVAFIDVNSYNGTKDTLDKAERVGIPVFVYKLTSEGTSLSFEFSDVYHVGRD